MWFVLAVVSGVFSSLLFAGLYLTKPSVTTDFEGRVQGNLNIPAPIVENPVVTVDQDGSVVQTYTRDLD